MATKSTGRLNEPHFAIAEVLEPRVLYSADALGSLVPLLGDELLIETGFDLLSVQPNASVDVLLAAANNTEVDQTEAIVDEGRDVPTPSGPQQLAFVDARVPEIDRVLDALEQSGIDVVTIGANDDGLLVISQVLAGRDDLTAVHIISHGSAGSLNLGNADLNAASVESNAAALTRWGDALTDDADILFYGCDFAANDKGVALVDRIAQLTAADVAASDDLTGNASLGADWDLELAVGAIETVTFGDSDFRQAWLASLDTIIVTTTEDKATNGNFSTIEAAGMSELSLRDAISASNNTPGHHTIILAAEDYILNRPLILGIDFGNWNLDLEVDNDGINSSLTISGAGEGLTKIIQTEPDRILFLKTGELTIENLTITGGVVNKSGGGVNTEVNTVLNTDSVTFDANESTGSTVAGGAVAVRGAATFVNTTFANNNAAFGGGIASIGTLILQSSTLENNGANASGGGMIILNEAGSSLTATDVMFRSNSAENDGGAIDLRADDAVFDRVTFVDNAADKDADTVGSGGAVFIQGARATFTNTTFSENHAAYGGAMYIENDVTIQNSTFYRNYDTNAGAGGLLIGFDSFVTLKNSVFDSNYSNNSLVDIIDIGGTGKVESMGFNVFTDSSGASFLGGLPHSTDINLNTFVVPMGLAPLAPSTGYVWTHAPIAGSPLINAGGSTTTYTTDATGALHDEIPDAGAHEYIHSTSVIYWIDTNGDIWRSNIDGTNSQLILETLESSNVATRDTAVDLTHDRIYWIAETGIVKSTTLDGSGVVVDVVTGLTATTGIAIDSVNNRLFVADRGAKQILWYDLTDSDPISTAVVVTSTTSEINDIEFDAGKQLLVWTEKDGRVVSRLHNVATDGDSGPNADIYTYSGNPDGLTLDTGAGRMFVVDPTIDKVFLINYAGDLLAEAFADFGQRVVYDIQSSQIVVSRMESAVGFDYVNHELADPPYYKSLPFGPEAVAINNTNGTNSPPVAVVLLPVDVVQSGSAVIDGTKLSSSDDFNSPSQLVWTLVGLPTNGNILVDGVELTVGQFFTQEQVNNSVSVVYQHDGSSTNPTDSIDVTLTDGTHTASAVQLVFNVSAIPVFTSQAEFDSTENSLPVGSVVTTDEDGGAPQYSLVGTVDDALLRIDNNTGALSFNAAPNFEAAGDADGDNIYNVTVQADDGNGGVVTQGLSITVTNVNEFSTSAISDSDVSSDLIAENAVIGTSVGVTALAQDQDVPDSVSYTLDTDAGGLFVIDSVSGVVTLNGALDYETTTSYSITIRATSTDTTTATRDYTIAVGDVNDTAPIVTPAQTLSIAENAAVNAVVGTVTATDADTVGSLHSWAITGGNADGVFQIDAATGQITIADTANLNYEATSQYTLSVQVGDGVNTSAIETVLVDITDVNEAPTFTSLPVDTVTEDAAYSYSITSNDVDADVVTITDITVPAWLTLTDNGDGTATLNGTPTNAEVGLHTIDLQISDGTLSTTQNFTLTVNNVNDVPAFTSPAAFTVSENITPVGSVVTTDEDGGAPQYSLVGTVDDTLLRIDNNTGALSFNAAPNFEAAGDADGDNIYNVTVQADDGNGGVVTQGLSITVTNVNEFSTSAISDSDVSSDLIAENAVIGTSVGVTALAQDQDVPDSVSYTLDTDAGGLFVIDSVSGVVTLNGALDYETTTSYSITIRATSTDTTTATRDYTIAVGDVNDTAPIVAPAQTLSIAENAAVNAVVGTVTATDADTVGSLHSWAITGGNADGVFQIDAATGQITIADTANLNYEATSQYTLSVQVGDGVNTSAIETVLVDITDVNEAPTFTSLPVDTVTEDAAYSYSITSNDVDADVVTITDITVPAWLTLTDNGDGTATLSGTPTNAEVGPHTIDLQISDGTLSNTQNFTLTVGNVNNAPHTLALGNASVAENSSGMRVGILSSIDDDPGDVVSYSVDDSRFEIRGNELFLSQNAELDYETEALVPVQITAVDLVGAAVTQTFEIAVNDENDAPELNIVPDVPAIAEGIAYSIPANIFGDVDGDTLSYTVRLPNGEALPDWLEFRESTADIVLVDATAASEVLMIELIADDGHGGLASALIELRFEPVISAAEPISVPAINLPTIIEGSTIVSNEPEMSIDVSEEPIAEAALADLLPDESVTDVPIEEVDLASLIKPLFRPDVVTVASAEDVVARLLNVRSDSQSADNIDSINLSQFFSESAQNISREYSNLIDSLDKKREEVAEQVRFAQTLVGGSVGITSGLSVGYLIWLIRGGTLMGSMLSSLPAWRLVDPLPMLGELGGSDDDDGETLESMVDDTLSPENSDPAQLSSPMHDDQQDD